MSLHDWEDRYACFPRAFDGEPVPEVVALAAELPAGSSILSLADGTGRHSLPLARAGHRVTAVKWVPAAAQQAKESAEAEHLPLTSVCVDGRRLPRRHHATMAVADLESPGRRRPSARHARDH